MGIIGLRTRGTGLWDSKVPGAVRDSAMAAHRIHNDIVRSKFRQIRSFADGGYLAETMAAAAVAYPETSHEWAKGGGTAYRLLRLTEMLQDRLAVIFHTPPTLYLHTGDSEPLARDDPTYGAQVRQWEQDADFARLDVVLPYIDASVSVMRQQIVTPAWVSDGDIEGCVWLSLDPHEVDVLQSQVLPSRIAAARVVTMTVRQPADLFGARRKDLLSTWTRDAEDGATVYGHWLHSVDGREADPALFGQVNDGREPWDNRYGILPFTLWQSGEPSGGMLYLPPDEALIQDQIGINLQLTDLSWGDGYTRHPMLWGRGGAKPKGKLTLSPNRFEWFTDDASHLDSVKLDSDSSASLSLAEWLLRACAVSRALPPDILNPGAARNLAALQEQRHDLTIRRERVKPRYLRALSDTFAIHKRIANFWAAQGARRVRYDDAIELGVRLAPIPRVEDRWQAAQARQLEMAAGLVSAAQELADRDGIPIEEAQRRVIENIAAAPPSTAPVPGRAPGDRPRPPGVERG